MFYDYLDKIKNAIDVKYHGKKISYVNSFENVKVDRDKELTKIKIIKNKVPVPKTYATRNYKEIIDLLNKGRKLYLKVNFGAMGKGITRIEKGKWVTNFIYRRGSIISRKGDSGWKFKDISGNNDFLKNLLKKDLVIEEEISSYILNNKKFDIRYYIVYGKVKHIMIRSAPVGHPVTNITQGGTKEKESFLKPIPKKCLLGAKKNAIAAVKALNLNLAGVDVMLSKRKIPYVIEVQSFPGFPEGKYDLSGKICRELYKA
jgi:glutathione synthase/RimK-type ligase-like ATP-grasp enzyme